MSNVVRQSYEWLVEQMRSLGDQLVTFSVRAVWATVVVLVVLFLFGRLRWALLRILGVRRITSSAAELIDNIAKLAVYVLAATLALGILGANSNSLVTALSLTTAALTLSLQDVLKNFVSGLYLLTERPFSTGDRIRVVGEEGSVERIDIRSTILRNDRAEQVLVPNFRVFSEVVQNRSSYRLHQLSLTLTGIDRPPLDARDALLSAVGEIAGLSGPAPRVELTKAGPDGDEFEITVWHPMGGQLRTTVVAHLRDRFPSATITVVAS